MAFAIDKHTRDILDSRVFQGYFTPNRRLHVQSEQWKYPINMCVKSVQMEQERHQNDANDNNKFEVDINEPFGTNCPYVDHWPADYQKAKESKINGIKS